MENKPKLGLNQDVISVDTSIELRTHIVNMVSQATKTIFITSRKMDTRLTNHSDFLDAIRSCISNNSNFCVKILIYQLEEFLAEHHQILDLSRRLSSRISIKVINKEHHNFIHDYILVDNQGIIYRELAHRYESKIEYSNKRKSTELTRQFNEAWEHGVRDSNLYRLDI
jgi:hypothetical protein